MLVVDEKNGQIFVTLTLFSRSLEVKECWKMHRLHHILSQWKIFFKLAKIYLFDKTKPLAGFVDLDPFFRVTGKFSLKYVLNQWMDFTLHNTDILLEQAKCGIRSLRRFISCLWSMALK